MDFEKKIKYYQDITNKHLSEVFQENDCLQKSVYDAMNYSIQAGGKRIRSVLALAVCDMLGGDIDDAMRVAVSVECIHTYSLIHDDLPCMDNDDLRRGLPTCHKKFGEATALLAGDGLLTFAFEYLADLSGYKNCSSEAVLDIISEFAKSAGCAGMIGGQVIDLENECKTDITEEILTYMHNRKTGALIKAAVVASAIAAGADEKQKKALIRFADALGLAFQIQDDILDCIGDEETLGKPIGSDAENKKTTYVTLLGLNAAKEKSKKMTDQAISALEIFEDKAKFLKELADYLVTRNK